MGRIKTKLIKRVSNELFKKHLALVKDNFTENKVVVGQITDLKSKKLRNIIAGYLTRLFNNQEDI